MARVVQRERDRPRIRISMWIRMPELPTNVERENLSPPSRAQLQMREPKLRSEEYLMANQNPNMDPFSDPDQQHSGEQQYDPNQQHGGQQHDPNQQQYDPNQQYGRQQ